LLEIGSSFVVKMSQNCTELEIVAREGGFFFGFAEQIPNVFRGRKGVLGSRWLRLLGF
jgi:hypothetical protein